MVTARDNRRRGIALIELMTALGIFVMVLAGFAASSWYDSRLLREQYFRAAAMEIVDGEIEVLAAGEWKAHPKGSHPYKVTAASAKSLPPGEFILTVKGKRVRLEWQGGAGRDGMRVAREVTVR